MLRAPISQAQPGMVLAMSVVHPRTARRLLAKGFQLDEVTIGRLRSLHVPAVWVEYPDTHEIRKFISPRILARQARLGAKLAGMFDRLHRDAHARLDYARHRTAIRDLIESLMEDPVAAAYVVEVSGHAVAEFRHAAAVSMLSLLLGMRLQGYLVRQRPRVSSGHARNLLSLGLGAALHDIGMMHLDPQVRERHRLAPDETDPEWRRHVSLGHRAVTGQIEPVASGVVNQHHQHFDGSGFPIRDLGDGSRAPMRGSDIHIFARIVCVADHYDRLATRPDRAPTPRVKALREMVQSPLADRFDPVILRALFEVVPVYPPGSRVTLNTGNAAAVVEWTPTSPCRPIVQPTPETALSGSWQSRGTPERLDLAERTDLWIVAHDGVDVSKENFELPEALRTAWLEAA